jgi:5-(carboxyamino)imidazole ribonucleotide synthase
VSAVLPGATIGILGGGQLGRMTAMAARSLGYHIHALDPDPSCAARFVVEQVVPAAFDDEIAAAYLARGCGVVTLEIEQISLAALRAAQKLAPVRPGPEVLAIIQDRGKQKRWLVDHRFPVGDYRDANSASAIADAVRALGSSFVKSCSGGYDGRSQVQIAKPEDGENAWRSLGEKPVVVEKALAIEAELSVLVARRPSGEIVVYPPALNHHEQRILAWSALPGPLPEKVVARASEMARALAGEMQVEGLLVLELFLVVGGELLVNELAPRPHNSYHASEVACVTSQFEQAVRAVCDLPLGSPEVVRPAAIANLLGEVWLGPTPPAFDAALAVPGVRVHLYGKRVARPGRKMGHLSATANSAEEAVKRVLAARDLLSKS